MNESPTPIELIETCRARITRGEVVSKEDLFAALDAMRAHRTMAATAATRSGARGPKQTVANVDTDALERELEDL